MDQPTKYNLNPILALKSLDAIYTQLATDSEAIE
jgi:hypothetical protein